MREKQQKKFERFQKDNRKASNSEVLAGVNGNDQQAVDKSGRVINLSTHSLTTAERSALERGFNFANSSNRIPTASIIAGVEAGLRKCKDSTRAERARATVAGVLRTARPPKQNSSSQECEALDAPRKNKDIIVLQADKGNATVVLDTVDYEKKAMAILDHSPFRQLQKDPTSRIETRVNNTLKKLLQRGEIDKETHALLRVPADGSRSPLFYGSVKLHKPENPIRPIVSAVGSATYQLAKFVSKRLRCYAQKAPSYLLNTKKYHQETRRRSHRRRGS